MSDLAERIARLTPEKLALLERQMRESQRSSTTQPEPVAVIGIGCRFPGGGYSHRTFWNSLVNGVDAIREIPGDRWDVDALYDADPTKRGKMATRWGGFLDDIELFDPAFFELTNREAVRVDPQQRLVMETAWSALEDAGLIAPDLAGSATGVFVSAHNLSSDYFLHQSGHLADIDPYSATGGAHSIIANRLSYWLDLQGPSMTVDTACSGSLVAAHLAVSSLRGKECDVAIAGGVNLILSPETTIALSGLQMMAPDGRCKTFDAKADGFVRGEGCGVVILKRLKDAQQDGDAVYAVIRGSAVNQDGRTNGLTAPNGLSQQRVLRRALKQAGVNGEQIGYVEAHGTGTAMGDPIEVEALSEVVGRPGDGTRCLLGSVKTNIGHLESAAGVAGLIKAVLCLHHEFVPPNLHFNNLNPHIDLRSTRFAIPTEGIPWVSAGDKRFAGVSSFGFGGTNAHMVLEEAPRETRSGKSDAAVLQEPLLVLSAHDKAALKALATSYVEILGDGKLTYRDICYTAACRRKHFKQRLAVLAPDEQAAAAALLQYSDGNAVPEIVETHRSEGVGSQSIWVFSGQGSQSAGMGRELLEAEPVFRSVIEQVDEVFVPLAGWSILDELSNPNEERLARTEVAQPAIFAVEIGLAALLKHYGVQPAAIVGHSLGEVAAAHVSGALSLKDAVTVIYHRGRLMQQLHGYGSMAAVFASQSDVQKILTANHKAVSIAAVNGPFSLTVSGEPQAVADFLASEKFQNQLLPVKYAFHSAQVEPLQKQLAAVLKSIRASEPGIPVYSTVTGNRATRGDFGPEYWARNIREPVLFADAIASALADGSHCCIEIGPHAVLGSAIEQCLEAAGKEAPVLGVLLRNRPDRMGQCLASMHVNGIPVDWRKYFDIRDRAVHLPSYPWQRHRCWFDPTPKVLPGEDGIPAIEDCFYRLEWPLRTPLKGWANRKPFEDCATFESASAAVASRREDIYRKHGAADSTKLVTAFEALAAEFAATALRELGFELVVGRNYAGDELHVGDDRHGHRIVERLFRLLEEHGVVSHSANTWTVCGELPATVEKSALEPEGAAAVPEALSLLRRCGPEVANVVKGSSDPLALLFSADYSSSAEWIYADAPFSRVANDLVAETVTALIDDLPSSRTLRVLEVGAGTGGTTRSVLPRLRPDRTEYVFTDLSPSFLSRAKEKFADKHFLHYELLNLERDPADQGFDGKQFDLIIAANVVHATADLRATLSRARNLLAPGGILLMLEGTARRGWIDLTFGLTEGWWRFTDTDLRAEHPLLDADAWQKLLLETGFDSTAAIPTQRDAAGSLIEQAIVLARTPAQECDIVTQSRAATATSAAPWIVFADRSGVAAALAGQLRSAGQSCVVVNRTDSESAFGKDDCRLKTGAYEDMVNLLRHIKNEHGSEPHAIVNLIASNEQIVSGGVIDWDASMRTSCGSLLHLLQSLEDTGMRPERGVWVATRGALPVMSEAHEIAVAQAPLWGFGRVAAREKPELWGGLVDLDFNVDADRDASQLRALVDGERGENQVALRSGDRFVARLVPDQIAKTPVPDLRSDRSYLIVGGLGNIGLQVAGWMVAHGARHLTLVSRRGLLQTADTSTGQTATGTDFQSRVDVVRRLEDMGAQITVVAADVADADKMADIFAAFGRERPPLAGVVHAAAVVEFEPLEQIDLDDLLAVLRSKVAGSWVLHELSAGSDLDFFILFSSLAAIAGFPQLSHYAAANSFQDALAHRRHELGQPALSINWGLWSDGRSIDATNKALFAKIGLLEMPATLALQGFERVFGSETPQQTIAWVDWASFRPIYESRATSTFFEALPDAAPQPYSEAVSMASPDSARIRLSKLTHREAVEQLQSMLTREVATILAVPPDTLEGRTVGFFEMGMDSIMTVELKRRLEVALACKLPTTVAFEYPTIDRMSDFIASDVLLLQAQSQSEPVSRTVRDSDSDDLNELSDEDLREMLDAELAAQAAGDE